MTFSYAISGLSADRLRVLLHPVNLDTDPDTPNFNNDVVTHIYNIYNILYQYLQYLQYQYLDIYIPRCWPP